MDRTYGLSMAETEALPAHPMAFEDAMPRTLLVLTELQGRGTEHLERAAGLAKAMGMSLRLAWNGEGKSAGHTSVHRLEKLARSLRRLFNLAVDVVEEPVDSLDVLRFHARSSDLVCVPCQGAQDRSTTQWVERLIRARVGPILVLGTSGGTFYQRVLVSTSLKSDFAKRLQWAHALAGKGLVDLLHSVDSTAQSSPKDDLASGAVIEHQRRKTWLEAHRHMASVARQLKGPAQGLGFLCAEGKPLARILEKQGSNGYGLVAVGARTQPHWMFLRRASLAVQLVAAARADTLIVPGSPTERMGCEGSIWKRISRMKEGRFA